MRSQSTGKPSNAPVLDRDWLAVVATMAGLIFSVGMLTIYSFGVFVSPLRGEIGWTRTALSAALALSQIGMAIALLLWGQLIDRIGPRRILLVSVVTTFSLVASMSKLTSPVWQLYVLFLAFPFVAAGTLPLGYSAVLIRLFDRHLGLALGLSAMGVGLGATVLPPLSQVLVANFGWRDAYLTIGIITLFTSLPAALICTRNVHRPVYRSGSAVPILPFLRERMFTIMCSIYFLSGIVTVGSIAQLVPMMIDRGFTPRNAGHIAALTGLAALISRAGIGFVLDRMQAYCVVVAVAFLTACSFLLLASGTGTLCIMSAVILLGVSIGVEVNFIAYLTRRNFLPAAFGRL